MVQWIIPIWYDNHLQVPGSVCNTSMLCASRAKGEEGKEGEGDCSPASDDDKRKW